MSYKGVDLLFVVFSLILILIISSCDNSQSLRQIMDNRDEFLGKEITLRGNISMTKSKCTKQMCREDNPCCNICSAELILNQEDASIKIEGESIGCRGNNCAMNCTPKENHLYTIKGIFKGDFIEISSYE